MSSTFSLMDVIILLCGLYLLYSAYNMKMKGEIKEGILIPKELPLNKCKDKAGYIQEMFPKTVLFGAVVTICSIINLVDDQYSFLGNWYYLTLVIFLVCTIWYAVAMKKSIKKYWP